MHIDSSAFVEWFKAAEEKLKTQTRRALELTAEASIIYAKTTTLFKRRTGALHSSLKPRIFGNTRARVSADGGHAHFIENGTKAHWIPKSNSGKRKMLRFMWNGEIIFRRRVWHPGTKARPFMKAAQAQATPLFSRLVIEAATFR
jgi:hypothetical protein